MDSSERESPGSIFTQQVNDKIPATFFKILIYLIDLMRTRCDSSDLKSPAACPHPEVLVAPILVYATLKYS